VGRKEGSQKRILSDPREKLSWCVKKNLSKPGNEGTGVPIKGAVLHQCGGAQEDHKKKGLDGKDGESLGERKILRTEGLGLK